MRRPLVVLALAAWASAAAIGRQAPAGSNTLPVAAVETLQRLQAAALGSDYAFAQVAYLTDSIGPRLSGSRQNAAAVKYAHRSCANSASKCASRKYRFRTGSAERNGLSW